MTRPTAHWKLASRHARKVRRSRFVAIGRTLNTSPNFVTLLSHVVISQLATALVGTPDPDTAAWAVVANVVLNLDEMLMKR